MVGMEVALALALGEVLGGECWQVPGGPPCPLPPDSVSSGSPLCFVRPSPTAGLELGMYFFLVLLALASGPAYH